MLDDITISLIEFNQICEEAGITPTHAANRERKGREGIVFTQLVFLTSDEGLRAGHRFIAAAGSVLEMEFAMFIADRIGWARGARTEINIDDVIVEDLPTIGANR